jgi:ATP-dependent exoDNAse (exonuclease V) alpha subunit
MNQEKALEILKSGENVFLTGSAGAGKTYVLNQYIEYLKERKIRVAVTASTGIAATHMNGTTIHSWCGMGIKNNLSAGDLRSMASKKYLAKNLEKVKVLIIDEISMLHRNQFELVDRILKYFKNSQEPFGSVQIVLAGDFFQLPPIGDTPIRERFAFMSPFWVEANLQICYLTDQYRQTNNSLNKILNEIRYGNVSISSIEMLNNAQYHQFPDHWTPTKIYTHNVDVDRINQEKLQEINSKSLFFTASTKGNQKLIDGFKKSVQAPDKIELKVGAKVMFVKNNPELGYINGSLGEVVEFTDLGLPLVKLLHGPKIIAAPETWSVDDDSGKSLAKYIQVPLRLAWAITVHKSQGMTIDAAEIDLSKTFEKGQGYVALSRLKELENLKLYGFNIRALEVEELALKADARFRELSEQAEDQFWDSERLSQHAKEFVVWCEGLTDPREIQRNAKKEKQKKFKKSTYELTKELIEQGKELHEISEERGYSVSTIINHLIRLKAEYPKLDLDRFRPGKKEMAKITEAYKVVKKRIPADEPFKIGVLYQKLNEEFDYEDLKLALLFME